MRASEYNSVMSNANLEMKIEIVNPIPPNQLTACNCLNDTLGGRYAKRERTNNHDVNVIPSGLPKRDPNPYECQHGVSLQLFYGECGRRSVLHCAHHSNVRAPFGMKFRSVHRPRVGLLGLLIQPE